MNLGQLRADIEEMIREQGTGAPVSVFIISARDVTSTAADLAASGKIDNDSQFHVEDVLTELQDNAGNPPFADQLTNELERLLIHWNDEPR